MDRKRPPTFSVDGLDSDMDFQTLQWRWSAPADCFPCKVRWDSCCGSARGAAPCTEQSDAIITAQTVDCPGCLPRRAHILPSGEYKSAPFVPKGFFSARYSHIFKKFSIFVAVPSEASVSSPSSVSSGVSKTVLMLTATLAQDAIIFLESAL